jgi:DNA-directed RNA polymerase specialized sigma24 family protein
MTRAAVLRAPRSDAALHTDLHELQLAATRGDAQAVGALALAFHRTLVAAARAVAGEEDAKDAVQSFWLLLLEGRFALLPPDPRRPIAWMRGVVRALARHGSPERWRDELV